MTKWKTTLMVAIALWIGVNSPALRAETEVVQKYFSNLPCPAAPPALPRIPNYSVNILAFGAVGGGQTLNTTAFQRAIEACTQRGGGKVVVPAGIWLTSLIQLASRINLHLEKGATILFNPRFEDYPYNSNHLRRHREGPLPISPFRCEAGGRCHSGRRGDGWFRRSLAAREKGKADGISMETTDLIRRSRRPGWLHLVALAECARGRIVGPPIG